MLTTQTLTSFVISKAEDCEGGCSRHTSHHSGKFQSIAASAFVADSIAKVAVKVRSALRRP